MKNDFFDSTKRSMEEYEKRITEISNGRDKTQEDREFILYINMILAKSLIEDLGDSNAVEVAKHILINQNEEVSIKYVEQDWRNKIYG